MNNIIPVGYRLGDTLYIYDDISHCPLSYDNGRWTVETGDNTIDENMDKHAAHIQAPCRNLDDWADSADDQLLKIYKLRLGPLHDRNKYELFTA